MKAYLKRPLLQRCQNNLALLEQMVINREEYNQSTCYLYAVLPQINVTKF